MTLYNSYELRYLFRMNIIECVKCYDIDIEHYYYSVNED